MEYIYTERAHLMCPNMCFGIVMCINAEFDQSRIADTVKCLSQAHPFLRALISHDEKENRFFYDVKEDSQVVISICHDNVLNIDSSEIITEFERITSRDFDLFIEGMLKITVWPSGTKTIVLMVFHHLLADGRGALELSREFAERKSLKYYNPGAMGNYSTAFSVELNRIDDDIYAVAKQVHEKVRMITAKPSSLYLVLQCYAALDPGLLDVAMMASRGKFESKAAEFIGKNFFHLDKAEGYSITNLGKTESDVIEDAYFIPPASPAIKKTWGVLTLNGKMRICTSER